MRSLLLLCLALALALAGLGVALLVDTRDARVLAGSTDAGSGEQAAAAQPADEAQGAEEAAAAAAAAGRVALHSVTAADIAAEAEAKLPPRVFGRALSPEGVPLPGAQVFASTGEHWGLVPLDLEPEAMPRGWPEVVRTEADAEGRFTFEKLKSGTLRLVIRAHGCAPLRQDRLNVPPAYKAHDLGDFTLAKSVRLAGRVVDRAGHGIVGARIFQVLESGAGGQGIAAPGHGLPMGESGADGAFLVDEIAAGPWRLLFDAAGYAVGEEEGRTEKPGEEKKGLYVLLEAGTDTCGRVLPDPNSPAPPGMRVLARLSEERDGQPGAEAGPPPSRLLRSRGAPVDAEGNFCLAGLERARRYRFTLWQDGPDGKPRRVPGVDVLSAWAGERGLVFRLKPSATITLRVVDAKTGAPLEEFCAWAGVGRDRVLRDEKNEVRRRFPDGRVEVSDLQPQTPARPVWVRVRSTGYKDYENKNVQLRAGTPTELGEIRLERAALVHVRVVDARDETPIEGARIVCGQEDKGDPADYLSNPDEQEFWGDLNWQFARSAADGSATFSSAPGQRVALRADAKGFQDSETLKQLLPTEGDTTLVLRLTRGGRVRVHVGDGFGHAVAGVGIAHKSPPVRGQGEDEWQVDQAEQKSDSNGDARFVALAPGLHSFRVHDQSGQTWHQLGSVAGTEGWVQVAIVEGSEETVELVAPPRGTVEGVVREGGRPLEGANLRLVPQRENEGEEGFGWGWSGPNDPLSSTTDHLGHFRYEGLRCGNYTLVIHHPTRRMPARYPIEVRAAERSVEFDLDVTLVEGRITDPSSRPLPGLEVVAYPVDGQGYDQEPYQVVLREDDRGAVRVNYEQTARRSARTDAQGRYELRGLAPNVPLRLHVEGDAIETYDSEPFTLSPDEARRGFDLALRMAGIIRVELEGGEPNGGSWYEVRALLVRDGKEELRSSTWVGPWNRRDDMRSLSPGHYKLVCTRQGGIGASEPATLELDLHEGETSEARFQAR